MKRILVATDFSTRSERALSRAALLARASDAELILVHIVDDDQPLPIVAAEKSQAAKLLEEQLHAAKELHGVRGRFEVVTGDPFDGILRTAEATAADLIVMGSHRRQFLRDVFIGTTIERVVRTGKHPVLMANNPAEHPYQSILAPVDMSDASAHALRTADALGFLAAVRVTVAHAFAAAAKGKMFVADSSKGEIASYVAKEQAIATREVEAFLAANNFADRNWQLHVREGSAVEVISVGVETMLPDLMVIGTRGHSGALKFLLGSVTETVLRTLEIDILAVPPR